MENLIKQYAKDHREKLESIYKDVFVTSKITKVKAINHFAQKNKGYAEIKRRVFFTYHVINYGTYIDVATMEINKGNINSKFEITGIYYNKIISALMQNKKEVF